MFKLFMPAILLIINCTSSLTCDPAYDTRPVWSPDGTQIAFLRDPEYGSEIFIMNADGSAVTRLTRSRGDDLFPVWSPDGKKIAFVSERDGERDTYVWDHGDRDIYVMDADGSHVVNLTNQAGSVAEPVWSPDGSQITFEREGHIWVVDVDGSSQRNLTITGNTCGYRPAWSPDGSKIAYHGCTDNGASGIYVMNRDGTVPIRLADGDFPTWSPDGNRIAFVIGDGHLPYNVGIYVIGVDGSNLTPFTYGYVLSRPTWSPDGSRIAFESEGNIWVANADGSLLVNLTENQHDVRPVAFLSWSPDGRQITFTNDSSGASFDHDVYVINADGSGYANLTNNPHWNSHPAWSPDGTRIAFVSDREQNNQQIWMANASSGHQTHVVTLPSINYGPVWSPDSGQLAFAAVLDPKEPDSNSEIFVVNTDGAGLLNLTDSEASESDPAWSTDGSQIAFARNGHVWVMDADGGNQTRLTAEDVRDREPTWSPHGNQIAFARGAHIWLMNVDGSDQTELPGSYVYRETAGYDWSPDGSRFVFSGVGCGAGSAPLQSAGPPPPPQYNHICLINVDGSGLTFLTSEREDLWNDRRPLWSPDGGQIAFSSYGQIWVMNADGTRQTKLTNPSSFSIATATWSPDSRQMALTDGNDIWIVDAEVSE